MRLPSALRVSSPFLYHRSLGGAVVNRWVGLVGALLLAISPWHIQVSRYADRSQLLPLLFCLGLWLFLRWRKEGGKLLWSALCLKTYASAEFFAHFLLVVQLCFIFRNCVRRADMRYGGWVFWPPVSYRRLGI